MGSYRSILAVFGLILLPVLLAVGIGLTVKRIRSQSNLVATVGVVSPTQTPTPTLSPSPRPPATPKTIYVAPDGLRRNKGTATSPIDLATAVSSTGPVRPGYVVELNAGIYRYSSVSFAPAGSGPDGMTIFKASPGARVIITTPTNTPPNIYMENYTRVDGLWIGGNRQTSDQSGIYTAGSPISHWKQIVNCTIFGYYSAVKASETEYALFQGNRFVHTGGGNLYHSIYISSNEPFPGPAGTATQHNIVDNNLFVAGGDGYAVHFWHNNHTNIITRNFVALHGYGIVHDGSDALVANNLLWRTTKEAMWMPGTNEYVVNNVFGAHAYFTGSSSSNTTKNNAYQPGDGLLGTNIINLTQGQEANQLGLSAASIDGAINTIDTAFNGSVDAIFANTTIEPAFATLKMTVPSGSPIYRTGAPWYDANPINVGPDCGAPPSVDAFWKAFRALGLKEYDSNGRVMP